VIERHRWRRVGIWGPLALILALVVYALVFAPKGGCSTSDGAAGSCAAPAVTLAPSPLVGVVVAVDTPSLGKVNSFDLRLADGSTVTLQMGVLENATQFSPSHLLAHEATSVPIRAFYRLEDGVARVYRLEDASPTAT
jgi:hypothetical protein